MANAEQVAVLKKVHGTEWNNWRKARSVVTPDLSGANLGRVHINGVDLSGANLRGADLSEAHLFTANLRGADLREAHLIGASFIAADLTGANLSGAYLNNADFNEADLSSVNLRGAIVLRAYFHTANLHSADLSRANLFGAQFIKADLRRANLQEADLTGSLWVRTNLEDAILTGARVYGTSAWDVKLQNTVQTNLIITPPDQPEITVDNLDVAQFIYLLLNNAKIRDVIDTITSKAVLILGRFTPERKPTLDALRDALRGHNYLPILFDFERPTNRDFTETVSTLAHLARFVIADLTDPRSIPQELTAVVPRLLSVPVRPLLLGSQSEWAMFSDLARYPQVIAPLYYTDDGMLLSCLEADIIAPAEQKGRDLAGR
jgi:hypothetical protein